MKELRRHQSGWVITFLAAVRNDWQSKLVLPHEGGRESCATKKCTHSVLFPRDFLVNRFPRILFRSPAFLLLSSLRFLPALFPSTFFSQAILFPSSTSLSLSLSLAARPSPSPFRRTKFVEQKIAPRFILRLAVAAAAPHVRITWDYNTCNRNYRSLPAYTGQP